MVRKATGWNFFGQNTGNFMKKKVKEILDFAREGFNVFIDDRALKLSAALSYYTIFSLPPLLLLIISLSGIFFGEDAIRGEIFNQINGLVGDEAARQIQDSLKSIKLSGNNIFTTLLGMLILLIGASGIFVEIQDSINFIWGLKAKPKRGLKMFLTSRLMSFSMIGVLGFLLMVSLISTSLMDVFSQKLRTIFPSLLVDLFYVVNLALIFIINSALFLLIFRTLPDGKVSGKITLIGAMVTAFLFMTGKFAIGTYLGSSAMSTKYGAGGSVILILAWVYYTAIILYSGAIFTMVYSRRYGKDIIPKSYAVHIARTEEETGPAKKNDK